VVVTGANFSTQNHCFLHKLLHNGCVFTRLCVTCYLNDSLLNETLNRLSGRVIHITYDRLY
jgi:hypothetical protein